MNFESLNFMDYFWPILHDALVYVVNTVLGHLQAPSRYRDVICTDNFSMSTTKLVFRQIVLLNRLNPYTTQLAKMW